MSFRGRDLGYNIWVEGHYRRYPTASGREADPKLVAHNREVAKEVRIARDSQHFGKASLGQMPSGGALDAKVEKRKAIDRQFESGKITIAEYAEKLEAEGLTDVRMEEHQKAKMKPLFSVGGGFGFGAALLVGAFILWKIID